jgi:hypothetical protein
MRGAEIVFAAGIRFTWKRRALRSFQWWGVLIVTTSLLVIGSSSVFGEPSSTEHATTFEQVLGIALIVASQFVQATQSVIEEHMLDNVHELLLVGAEGIWGFLFCVLLGWPIAAYTPLPGIYENMWDTFAMLASSLHLLVIFAVYVVVILLYNVFAMKVTGGTDSVTRNVLDTARTLFIWLIATFVHYAVSPALGEPFTWPWSLLQLAGFCILVSGLFTYNHVVELPCIEYDATSDYEDVDDCDGNHDHHHHHHHHHDGL